jgi:hypothetical protein
VGVCWEPCLQVGRVLPLRALEEQARLRLCRRAARGAGELGHRVEFLDGELGHVEQVVVKHAADAQVLPRGGRAAGEMCAMPHAHTHTEEREAYLRSLLGVRAEREETGVILLAQELER